MSQYTILAESEVFLVLGRVEDEDEPSIFEAISLKGVLFIVPEWEHGAMAAYKRPAWIVGIAPGAYRPVENAEAQVRFQLAQELPQSAFLGRHTVGYAVIRRPSVRVILTRH